VPYSVFNSCGSLCWYFIFISQWNWVQRQHCILIMFEDDKSWDFLDIFEGQKTTSFNWLKKFGLLWQQIGVFSSFLMYRRKYLLIGWEKLVLSSHLWGFGRLYFLISWLKLGHFWHFWGTKGYIFWLVGQNWSVLYIFEICQAMYRLIGWQKLGHSWYFWGTEVYIF